MAHYKAYDIDSGDLVHEAPTSAELFDEITEGGSMDVVRSDESLADYAVYELDDELADIDLHHVSNLPDEATLIGHYQRLEWEYDDAA